MPRTRLHARPGPAPAAHPGRPEDWRDQALCQQLDPELWSNPTTHGDAAHQCVTHCPVIDQCAPWAAAQRWNEMVVGGILWIWGRGTSTGRPAKYQPTPTDRACRPCRGDHAIDPTEREHTRRGPGRPPAPCGTYAAYRRHCDRGEFVDDACSAAARTYHRDRDARRRAEAAA